MIKKTIILLLLLPNVLFAQLTDDFEDAEISNWTESTAGRWVASDISPLNGAYSLHHIFDNPDAGKDQVSVALSAMNIAAQNTSWRFKIKYDYNPSDGNNWSVFLVGDAEANEMLPGGTINGYALGVNFTGSDDILKFLKITAGSASEVITTSLNWDDDTDPSDIVALEIVRTTAGEWEVLYNANGDFNSLTTIGTGTDNTYQSADYFGVYYDYTSSADRNLWIDDIYIGPEIVDVIKPRIDSLYVLSSQKLKIDYSEKIDSVIATTKLNYTLNGGIGNPDSVVVDTIHQTAELFFNQKFTDSQQYNITVQNIEDEEGNVINDTTLTFNYEYIKPLNVEIISINEIAVQFSRKVDTISAEDEINYSLDDEIGNPNLADILTDDSTKVQLQFATDFTNASYYDLTVQNVADRNLDSLQSEVVSFLYFIPEQYDVVVNEIMADPNPEVNLPNHEYIEIKNTTEFAIDLTGWKFRVGSSERIFPGQILDSAEYITLCSNTAAEFLDDYGKVIDYSSFPSLTNSGTSIVIFDDNENVIDSISYTADWYADTDKEDGGWSLEKIDPLNNCSGITNWKASEDANGGTPGQENSVYAQNIDNTAPQISKVEIISDNQLRVIFNEPLTEQTILEKSNYQVNNGIGNPFSVVASSDFRQADLLFSGYFPQEVNLTLSVENVKDYCGNVSSVVATNFIFYLSQPYDVVINEIMANPDPAIGLPEVEYIELYNTTDYAIQLKDWTLTVGSTQKYFSNDTIVPGGYLILCDEDEEAQLSSFGSTSTFSSLSLTDGEQTLVLRNKENNIISQVSYTENWYQDEFKADGGWSLEQIDPFNPCGEEANWMASVDESGGTPGKQNSVMDSNPDGNAPILLRIAIIDDQNIKLFFNESIDSLSAMQTNIYNVDNGIGNPISVDLNEPSYKSLTLKFPTVFDNNTLYNLEVSRGIADCSGNEMNTSNTAKFSIPVLPASNDLVINEILFNPLPDGVDFVEIHNRSEKTIDLKEILIASYDDEETDFGSIERITLEGYLIFPGEYLVITENPEKVQQDYITTNPNGFITIQDLPNYNDDEGRVMLLDAQQNIIDNVGYNEDMHFALLATNEGVSLERINYNRQSDDKTNWHSASELVGFATPADENSQFTETTDLKDKIIIDPEVFSPDNDGFEDFANISFTLDEPGYVANIKIYDSRGRLIRYLANNRLLGIDGVITWDGLDDKNQKAAVGIYVVFIEIFDLEGNVKRYKKSVVLAARY